MSRKTKESQKRNSNSFLVPGRNGERCRALRNERIQRNSSREILFKRIASFYCPHEAEEILIDFQGTAFFSIDLETFFFNRFDKFGDFKTTTSADPSVPDPLPATVLHKFHVYTCKWKKKNTNNNKLINNTINK